MERKTYTINASERAVGRIATEVSDLLRGKNEPSFERHIDKGGFVIVENIKEIRVTGKKLDQKTYYHYSGYPGGLKEKKMGELFDKNPAEVLRKAVYNMLPKNRLRKEMIKRLTVK
jgi:large subunit ribosomal protein L13